jgi:hypothetical protein
VKKIILVLLFIATSSFAIEQTICFSQEDTGSKYSTNGNPIYIAMLGDNATLNGGKCNGRKLADMNKDGWRLVTVVAGLQSSFGIVLEKGK